MQISVTIVTRYNKSKIKIDLKTNKFVKFSVEINGKFNEKIIKTQIIATIFYWHTTYAYKPSKTNYTLIEKSRSSNSHE